MKLLLLFIIFITLPVVNTPLKATDNLIECFKPQTLRSFTFERSLRYFKYSKELVYIVDCCMMEGVYPPFYLSLLKIENPTLNPYVVNNNVRNGQIVSKDLGIGQLNTRYISTFEKYVEYENFDPFNYKHNIEASVKHFKYLLSIFSIEEAVMAYNCGEYAVKKRRIPSSTLGKYLPKWKENMLIIFEHSI